MWKTCCMYADDVYSHHVPQLYQQSRSKFLRYYHLYTELDTPAPGLKMQKLHLYIEGKPACSLAAHMHFAQKNLDNETHNINEWTSGKWAPTINNTRCQMTVWTLSRHSVWASGADCGQLHFPPPLEKSPPSLTVGKCLLTRRCPVSTCPGSPRSSQHAQLLALGLRVLWLRDADYSVEFSTCHLRVSQRRICLHRSESDSAHFANATAPPRRPRVSAALLSVSFPRRCEICCGLSRAHVAVTQVWAPEMWACGGGGRCLSTDPGLTEQLKRCRMCWQKASEHTHNYKLST